MNNHKSHILASVSHEDAGIPTKDEFGVEASYYPMGVRFTTWTTNKNGVQRTSEVFIHWEDARFLAEAILEECNRREVSE